jgi:protein TonB
MGVSVVAHTALAVGIGRIEAKTVHEVTAIEIAEVAPPPPPTAPIEAKPASPEPQEHTPRKVAAPAPAPAEAPPETPQLGAALPDFGLSLSGGVGGDGIAVPVAAAAPKVAAPVVKKELSALPAAVPADACSEQSKPKPKNVPQPAYTAAASAAAIEGKVRLSLTVDEQGNVIDVKVLQGLGYGLDEAALDAARQASFDPALACGKAVRATFTISMRFSAS